MAINCPCCANRGRITFDLPDCIEGHKLSAFEMCPICNGRPIIPSSPMGKALLTFYKTFEREQAKVNKERNRKLNARKRALKKLTPTERKVLGVD